MNLASNEIRYKIKQKVFSWSDTFHIQDEYGGNVFSVKGEIFTLFKKLRLFDMLGNELCYIQQEPWKFMPEYNIFSGGMHVANVKKELAFFKHKFNINCALASYEVIGDFWAHEFQIMKNGYPVATISKKLFSWGDSYSLVIAQGEDYLLLLSLVIVIDMCLHNGNK
ncbi:hypothetical protein RCL1_009026 [Eukaryota sp. TZLM3-RCL]